MSTIPEIRDELAAISARLLEIVEELKRRPAIRKSSVKSRAVTPHLNRLIRRYAAAHPDASYEEMAQIHGVNTGRISEAIRGRRK